MCAPPWRAENAQEKGSAATAAARVVVAGNPRAMLQVTAEEGLHLPQRGAQSSANLRWLPSTARERTYAWGNSFLTGYFYVF